MVASKQTFSSMAGAKGRNPKAAPAAVSGKKEEGLKPCNPSVCVGGAQPSSCYCPTAGEK